jgi:hypothetical protein
MPQRPSSPPARIRGVSVVDDAVLACESAHARPLAYVRVHIGSAHGSKLNGAIGRLLNPHPTSAAIDWADHIKIMIPLTARKRVATRRERLSTRACRGREN